MDYRNTSLFERTYIGKMPLKNRFVMAPMGTGYDNADGTISRRHADYSEARAKGGFGMIICEVGVITPELEPWMPAAQTADTDLQQSAWVNYVDRIKGYGCRTCLQLNIGLGRNGFMMEGAGPMVSASVNRLYFQPDQMTLEMTNEQVKRTVAHYGSVAKRAKKAGFDCVEVHAHLGYLLDQFMTEAWNRRTDEYGGNFENRMRFPKEIIESIRSNVGPDYPILFRLSAEHRFPGLRTLEDGLEIVKALDSYGVDAFDIDAGCYESHMWVTPPTYLGDACMVDAAAAVRKVTSKPALNAGNHTPQTALEAVEKGKADYIIFGRQAIAEPEFVNKLYRGEEDRIRPCMRCNEYCISGLLNARPVSCGVNATAGVERDYVLTHADIPKQIVVVGGGPGGLEAARVAAKKGHKVSLYEKNDYLGGQVAAASTPPFKTQLRKYLDYLIGETKRLGVEIHTGVEVDPDFTELKTADEIVVAMGAAPFTPPIKGIENAVNVIDAHLGALVGQRVVICGGGLSGCDCALEQAMHGKEVTIVEMLDNIAPAAFFDNYLALTAKLAEHQVRILTGHKVLNIEPGVVTVEGKDGKQEALPADTVISAFGMRPRRDPADKICDKYPTAKQIGDCSGIGQVGEAVRAGFFAAYSI